MKANESSQNRSAWTLLGGNLGLTAGLGGVSGASADDADKTAVIRSILTKGMT